MAIKPYMGLMGSGMFFDCVASTLEPASERRPHEDIPVDSANPDFMNRARDDSSVFPYEDRGLGPLVG